MCENIALGGGGSHVVKNSIADSLAFFSAYFFHHSDIVAIHLKLRCFPLQSLQYLFVNCRRKKKVEKKVTMPLHVSWQIRQTLNLNIYNAIVCFLANTTNIELKYLQCHCMLFLQHSKLRIVKIFCLPECSPRHRQPRWVYQQAWNNRS